jgi:uncharacterized protein (TIGR01777 family)
MRFLFAGGTGYLGTRLRRRLELDGHEITVLTRGAPEPGQVRWDPARAPLGVDVVENADVVVNVSGSSLLGNPHSSSYARRLSESRVQTTHVLAEAIAASERKPSFLAGNGSSFYGDHGDEELTEDSDSRGDALLTRVTRDWQAATGPASGAGARVCVLRTAPVFGPGSMAAKALRLIFGLGVGGRLGSGRQYFALVSAHDWVEAVTRLATDDGFEGPVNLATPQAATNAEFTAALGRALHRPTVVPVPASLIRLGAGPMAPELLNSVRMRPQALLRSGFEFRYPTVESAVRYAFAR